MDIKYIIFVIIVLFAIQNIQPVKAVEVSFKTAKNKVDNLNYHHVIDTRTWLERQTGYHVYSMNIPSDNLNILLNKIKNEHRHILVISKNGEQATNDAKHIVSMGYRNVEYLNDVWTRLI